MNQVHSMLPGFTPRQAMTTTILGNPSVPGKPGHGSLYLQSSSNGLTLSVSQDCSALFAYWPRYTMTLRVSVSGNTQPHMYILWTPPSIWYVFFFLFFSTYQLAKKPVYSLPSSNYPFLQTRSLACLKALYFPNQNSPVMFVCPLMSTKQAGLGLNHLCNYILFAFLMYNLHDNCLCLSHIGSELIHIYLGERAL